MICSMDISNVIYLFKKKFHDTIFFYSTLKSNCVGFHQSQLQVILSKNGSHFEKNKMKTLYAICFGTLRTRRSEQIAFFWTSEGGNCFREYF
jgi:hypothetical protein